MTLVVFRPIARSSRSPSSLDAPAALEAPSEFSPDASPTTTWDFSRSLPPLLTARLQLRSLHPSDARDVLAMHDDPEVRLNTGEFMHTIDDAESYIAVVCEGVRAGLGAVWGIARGAARTNPLIGVAGLGEWSHKSRSATLGYLVARRSWGAGVAREAVAAVLDFGVTQMRLQQIVARSRADNERSIRVLRHFGFEHVAPALGCAQVEGGDPPDLVTYQLQLPDGRLGRTILHAIHQSE